MITKKGQPISGQDIPLKIDKTHYTIPWVRKRNSSLEKIAMIKTVETEVQKRVEFFLKEFEQTSNQDLLYKVNNENYFCAESIAAAKQIIKKRNL